VQIEGEVGKILEGSGYKERGKNINSITASDLAIPQYQGNISS